MLAVTRTQSSGLGGRGTRAITTWCAQGSGGGLYRAGEGRKGVGGTATAIWANGPEETLQEGTFTLGVEGRLIPEAHG